jgi:hypothetical protein
MSGVFSTDERLKAVMADFAIEPTAFDLKYSGSLALIALRGAKGTGDQGTFSDFERQDPVVRVQHWIDEC